MINRLILTSLDTNDCIDLAQPELATVCQDRGDHLVVKPLKRSHLSYTPLAAFLPVTENGLNRLFLDAISNLLGDRASQHAEILEVHPSHKRLLFGDLLVMLIC